MPQLVQFDDLGLVEFPDDATDEQIAAELTANKDRYRRDLTAAQGELRSPKPEPATGLEALGVTAQMAFKQLGNVLDANALQAAQARRKELDGALAELQGFEAEFPEGTPDPGGRLKERRDTLLSKANAANNEALRAQQWQTEAVTNMAERAPELAALGPAQSEVMQRFNAAEGWDALKILRDNPAEVLANVMLQSTVLSAPALGLGAAGSMAAGPLGSAAGVAEGSYLVEFGAKLGEELEKELANRGKTLGDLPAVEALLRDQTFMDGLRNKAAAKAVPVAAFDALTAGLAGKFLGPALKKGGKLRIAGAGAAEAGMQMVGGAAGEAAGELAAGDKLSVKDIALEALAELPGGVRETAQNVLVTRAVEQASAAGLPKTAEALREQAQTLPVQPAPSERQVTPNEESQQRQEGQEVLAPSAPVPAAVNPDELAPGQPYPNEGDAALELPKQAKPADVDAVMAAARQQAAHADKPPRPMADYKLTEEGDYNILDAARDHGGIGAPKFEDVLRAVASGRTDDQLLAEWNPKGGGEYDSLRAVFDDIRAEASKLNPRQLKRAIEILERKDFGEASLQHRPELLALRNAYKLRLEGPAGRVDQTLQGMQADRGFAAVPESPDELIEQVWAAARGQKQVKLSPLEMSLYWSDVVGSRVGRSDRQNGGNPVETPSLRTGDKFSVRGAEMTVQGVDPDTLEVIVEETGGKSKARLWGRQRISPEINPVIYPDRGSLVRAETLPDMQPDAPADVDAPFAAAPTGVGEPVDLQKSLDEALAALGMPSGSVRIQNATAPRGAGLHSGARAGRFDVVLVDPVHVRRQLASGLDLQRAMEEEVLHNLDGAAMFHAWQEAGAKGTFRGWFDQQYRQVAEGMTAFERREAQRLYGDKFRDDVQMAMEYVRMLLQGRIGRGATESGYKRGTGSALDRVLRWLRDFYGNLTGKLAASRGVRERVKAVEQLDKASIDTAAKAEAVADTGAAAPEPEAKGPFYVFRGGEPFAMARSREVAEHLFWEIQNNKGGQVSLHGAKPDGSPGGRLPDPPQSAWLGDLTGAAAPGQDDFLTRLFNSGLAVPVKRGNEQRTTAPSGATGSPEQDVGMAVEGGSREGGVAAGDEAAPDAPAAEGTGQEGGSRSQREFEGLSKFVGDAGTGAPGGSGRGELLEPQTRTEVELTEAFQQKLWDRTYSYLHAQGRTLSAAQRDEAHTFIFSRLFNVARDFIGDGGTEARFGTARIIAQRFNNYLEWTNAQKREGGKETVALNAPAAGMEEGEGSTDEVIADQANPLSERNAVLRASFYRAIERLDRQDREIMDAWLDGLASGSRGWEVAMADRLGVSKARVTQLKAEAGAKFARAWSEETGGKEWERSEDERFLTSAAGPGLPLSPVGGRPRELSVPARLLRAVTPNRWGMVGYLQQAATTADTPAKGSALRGLANRVIEYFDRKADNTAQTTSFYYRWREKHDGKARVQALGEWSQWVRTAQARDAGVQPAAQWQAAEAYAQTVSPAAQELIAWTKKMGVDMGREMTRLGVQVQMPNGQWRSFQNLGEQEFPRRLSREVEDILRDPDAASNSPAYQQLLAEMVANDPKRFPDAQAADAWLKETAKSAATNGAFYAGAERARGTKLPDRFYDYTIDGFIQHLESWSGRMAQIHAFGQQRTAELPPAFERAQNSTADDALKSRLAEFWADISDHRIRSTAEKLLLGVLLPLASIRYLTSVMTSVRNLAGGLQNTAENLGYWRTLAAGTKGVADAAVAAGRTLRSASKGDFILHEPKLVQDGADAGTVQRSLYLASVFDQDPNSRLLGALGSTVLRPYQLIEQWNRGVNTAAAMAWLKDAQVRLQTQPASGWSMKAKAQLQRWGFKGGDLADLLAGNPETVRRFLRTAVGEKQYSYNATQTPLIFNSAWGRFLLQFQKWGAQRQRDLHRNVLLPALVGEQVDGRRVRDVMPLLRFIGGTFGQTALVAAFAALVFGRERKDQTWDEVYRAASEDEQAAVNLALGRIVRDITATGGAGILGDHARGFLDAVSRGRNKQLVNPPGLTLASDVMQLVRNQVERGGDAAAFGRDLWDTLVGPTPLPREVQDAALTSVLADTDAGRLKEARNDVGVVRALARRWLKETGAEDRSGGKQPKSPNSELYDQVNEALLIGDVTAAAALRDQFLHDPERKGNVPDKLAALKASVKRRAPLITGGQMGADDEQRFIEWARNRRPDVADRAERLRMRYRQAAQAAGVW